LVTTYTKARSTHGEMAGPGRPIPGCQSECAPFMWSSGKKLIAVNNYAFGLKVSSIPHREDKLIGRFR